ncbi:MAG TPA: TetR/AcrR family transcriptional regulator [Anaerolineae bacterium]|nr:TetR/AcrR family transcriptional regulator [Anaerolineae bacterium]
MTIKATAASYPNTRRRPVIKAVTPDEPITKGERTRASIIDAAYQLFLQNGFHGTSMRDIARAAGIALGGIYNHFDTKEDIFLAMMAERHSFMNIAPALQAARGDTVEELVCDAATKMIEALGQSQNLVSLMFIEQVEFNGKHIHQLIKQFYPGLKEFVERLTQVEGALRPIPKPVLLRVFIGLFFSYYMTERLLVERQPAKHPHHNDFDYFVEIYLHGVLAEG